jgi:hypothetical protein
MLSSFYYSLTSFFISFSLLQEWMIIAIKGVILIKLSPISWRKDRSSPVMATMLKLLVVRASSRSLVKFACFVFLVAL